MLLKLISFSKNKKNIALIILAIFLTNNLKSQNLDKMSFKEKLKHLKANYVLVDMSFNNNLKLDLYYSFRDDIIYVVNVDKSRLDEFEDYLSFSNYLYNTHEFELDFKERYSEFQRFKTIYLRHNLCLNRPFLSKINDYIDEYLERFNSLFGLKISPYEDISKKSIDKINMTLQDVIDSNYDEIFKYEIPILIFVGEYFRKKHGINWELLEASNDFGNNFVIPSLKVNGVELELSTKIYRYLINPKLRRQDENFRFDYFLDLDFIATQSSITPKKQ